MLRYNLKHPAKKKRDWLQQIKKEGLLKTKKPDDDDEVDPNQPVVIDEAIWLWRAFNILNARRLYAPHGPQPIALTDVESYIRIEGLEEAEGVWLMEVVDLLDRIYIEDVYNKLAKDREKSSKKGRGARGR